VFIGVWGILVSELQVPSSIVFGDVMKYSGSFVYGQWTSCYTVSVIHHGKQWSRYSLGLAFFKDSVPQRYDCIIFVTFFGHMDD